VNDEELEVSEDLSSDKKYIEPFQWHIPSGIVDFVELENIQSKQESANEVCILTRQFNNLVLNVMESELDDKSAAVEQVTAQFTERIQDAMKPELMKELGEKRKVTKREQGMDFTSKDFAFVPDASKPSTWKLRISETPGKVTVAQLGRAAAAFSAGGFRGNRVELPSGSAPSVKRRIRSEYAKLGVSSDKIPASVKSAVNFTKQKDGSWRWMTIYSNCYRDQDNPPEIISEKSHRNFVKMVEDGIVPYPELWLWHIKETKFGIADFVGFTDDGFAIASGTVDKGKEYIAENLSQIDNLKTSHGMPKWSIKRDDSDKSIITAHISKEITVLSGWAAANKLTGSYFTKGQDMLTDDQKEFLKTAGYNDEELGEFEKSHSELKDQADSEDIERKDASDEEMASKEEVAEVVAEVTAPLLAAIKSMAGQIVALQTEVKSLSEDDGTKIAKAATLTPQASLQDLIANHLATKTTAIADVTPNENKAQPLPGQVQGGTGIPFLDGVIAKSNGMVR
jgi:hypothetical protein